MQPKECAEIARFARNVGLNIWCYTGYTFEQLLALSKKKPEILDFLQEIDILVDGRFMLEKKSYSALFRGSTNQRLIDVKKSLEEGNVILKQEAEEISFSFISRKKQGLYV